MLRKSKQIKLGCIKAFFRVGIYCHIKKLPQITTCILCADLVDTRTSKCIQSFFLCVFLLPPYVNMEHKGKNCLD